MTMQSITHNTVSTPSVTDNQLQLLPVQEGLSFRERVIASTNTSTPFPKGATLDLSKLAGFVNLDTLKVAIQSILPNTPPTPLGTDNRLQLLPVQAGSSFRERVIAATSTSTLSPDRVFLSEKIHSFSDQRVFDSEWEFLPLNPSVESAYSFGAASRFRDQNVNNDRSVAELDLKEFKLKLDDVIQPDFAQKIMSGETRQLQLDINTTSYFDKKDNVIRFNIGKSDVVNIWLQEGNGGGVAKISGSSPYGRPAQLLKLVNIGVLQPSFLKLVFNSLGAKSDRF